MGPQVVSPQALAPQVPLEPLLEELGLSEDTVSETDDREQWIVVHNVTGADAKLLASATIGQLARLWPGYFTAEIRLEQLVEADLLSANALEQIQQLDDLTLYQLKLRLDKAALLRANGDAHLRTRLFVTCRSFRNVSNKPYIVMEESFFGDGALAHVVFPGSGVALVGPALALTSFDELANLASTSDEIDEETLSALEAHHDQINADHCFARLTPAHLAADGKGWDTLAGHTLARMLAHCAALYTADRVRLSGQAGVVMVHYRGSSGDVEIDLDDTIVTNAPRATAQAASELVRWTFRPEPTGTGRSWSKERLSFTRTILHERLRLIPAAIRTASFGSVLIDVSGELDWHWRTFIGGQIEQHSTAMRDFKDSVTAQSLDYAGRTAGLTGSILDAMKAALAAVLGSFVGAALSDSFNATIFRIGLVAYASYLFLFAGVLGLGSSFLEYRAATTAYDSRRRRAVALLTEQRVADLEDGLLASNRKWYLRAIGGAAVLYVVVLGLAIWAILAVPGILETDAPDVVATSTASLSATEPEASWSISGVGGVGALVATFDRPGDGVATLSVKVTGQRTNTCRLENPQLADALLLRDSAESDRAYLVTVDDVSDDGLKLVVIEVRGPTGLDGRRDGPCIILGQEGIDWNRPDWATPAS